MRRTRGELSCLGACAVLSLLLAPASARATFHFAHTQEILTRYESTDDVQFIEILMDAGGQNLVSGVKFNTFDAQGNFIATILTVSGNVLSGSDRSWLVGTPAFETEFGIQADFEFPNASLPVDGGMVCWGKPGNNPTPVTCPDDGTPYVDCIAYGTYSGPTNDCIGDPNPVAPSGHSLVRVSDTRDNATDFVCSDSIDPENNAGNTASLPSTINCPGAVTTTTLPVTTTTLPVTTTSLPVTTTTNGVTTTTTLPGGELCGDANGDQMITASDALAALRTAVGSGTCPATICDVDASGSVTAGDALRILANAVGQSVELNCPSA